MSVFREITFLISLEKQSSHAVSSTDFFILQSFIHFLNSNWAHGNNNAPIIHKHVNMYPTKTMNKFFLCWVHKLLKVLNFQVCFSLKNDTLSKFLFEKYTTLRSLQNFIILGKMNNILQILYIYIHISYI